MRTVDVEKSKQGAFYLEGIDKDLKLWETEAIDPSTVERESKDFFRFAQESISSKRRENPGLSNTIGTILHQDIVYQQYPNGTVKKHTGDSARLIKKKLYTMFANMPTLTEKV